MRKQRFLPGYRLVVAMIMLLSMSLTAFVPKTATCSASMNSVSLLAQNSANILWGPYLTWTDTTSTIINVKTLDESLLTVEYAAEGFYKANQSLNLQTSDNVVSSIHHIKLTGLEPDTTYYYQVSCNNLNTPVYSFSTFPVAGTFSFIVYGDTQDELPNFSQAERHKLVADRIAQEDDALFVLNTGDLVNDGDDNANWNRYFEVTRLMGAEKPVFPVHGKHDGTTQFYEIFGISPFYSFNCTSAHFAVLDSIDEPAGQVDWLRGDLANQNQWKFVFFHYPMYTSETNHFGGWENLKNEWESIFTSSGVDAVWNGHIHVYERLLENGITYIVGGIGGGPYGTLNAIKYPGSQNSLERTLGYAKVTVNPAAGTATVKVIRVADISLDGKQVTLLPAGTVFETFTLNSPPVISAAASKPTTGLNINSTGGAMGGQMLAPVGKTASGRVCLLMARIASWWQMISYLG